MSRSPLKLLTLLLLQFAPLAPLAEANPITSSWFTDLSGQYARIYPDLETEAANLSAITWEHPTGNSQLTPTYAGVHEISVTNTNLYIRTSGLGFHVMGPWYGGRGDIFNNYPGNTARSARFPLTPVISTIPRPLTGGGPIGYLVDGVSMFDSRDGFSYINATASDAAPSDPGNRGDGIWNRDAFINEVVTFDISNSHPLTELLHYHAQPKGLRHLLNDSVDYDVITNNYTEAPNGTHSPLLGWNFDGFPFYGPYGYSHPTDPTSGVRRMISGFQRRDGSNGSTDLLVTGRTTIPAWAPRNEPTTRPNIALATTEYGPDVDAQRSPLGHYIEDNAYKGDLTGLTFYDEATANTRNFNAATDYDLNEYNVRWCVTPEFPEGTWAYFMCIDPVGLAVFPYTMSRYHYGVLSGVDEVNLPANREVIFEGGPEAAQSINSVQVDQSNGDVTLAWSGVEGGTYLLENSADLSNWETLHDDARTSVGNLASNTDSTRQITDTKQFYRGSMMSLKPFDDNGYDYFAPINPTFSATFSPLPPLDQIATITVGGVTATILGSDGNTLFLDFDDAGITPGDYVVNITYTPQGGTATQATSTNTYTVDPPRNVLLLIVDDWGLDSNPLDDLGIPGTTFPNMPNLQLLADNGLTFTNAYAQPVCAPTRASIITGRHGFRNGVGHPTGSGTLNASELTLPEIFTAENSPYSIASFGKWHLGGGATGPANIGGWPEFRGYLTNIPDYFEWSKVINGTTSTSTTYVTTDQVDDTVNFINAETNPWFVWLAFSAPHSPYHNPPADLHDYPVFATNNNGSVAGADQRGAYEASLQALDTEIGRLLETVDLTTTNVIILGDNGTPGGVVQAPYSEEHSKDTLYEGGVRVPMIAIGPDVTMRGNTSKIVHCVDIFSTVLDIADIDIESATSSVDVIDSQSLLPIFKGQDTAERCIIAERHTTTLTGTGASLTGRSIRLASHPDYKLIVFGDPTSATDVSTFEMYDIANDINEQTPLAIPAAIGATHYLAYTALMAKNFEVGPASPNTGTASEFLYLELPTTPTGSQAVPGQTNTDPLSVTVDGEEVTFISRVDITQNAERYWVKCSVPVNTPAPYMTAIVTFPPNNNNNLGNRVFTAVQIVTP